MSYDWKFSCIGTFVSTLVSLMATSAGGESSAKMVSVSSTAWTNVDFAC